MAVSLQCIFKPECDERSGASFYPPPIRHDARFM